MTAAARLEETPPVAARSDNLSPDDVYRVVSRRAATTPLTTTDLRDYCRLLREDCANASTDAVRTLLKWLHHRDRITRIPGTDTERLQYLGVEEPQPRRTYWALPAHGVATP
jgi:hypothetical protein